MVACEQSGKRVSPHESPTILPMTKRQKMETAAAELNQLDMAR